MIGLCIAIGMQAQTLGENARISLLTCSPGEELYARYGHTAIRVLDETNDIDIVFNYGIFDFNTDHPGKTVKATAFAASEFSGLYSG